MPTAAPDILQRRSARRPHAPTRQRQRLLTAILLALLASGCAQRTTSSDNPGDLSKGRLGALDLTPCSLPSPIQQAKPLDAQCTTFEVPEDRSLPGGRKIRLNLAWIPAGDTNDPAPDPVFFIAGGPGQSAVDTFPGLAPVFKSVMKKRDIILVDQRGTGKSNLLQCKGEPGQAEGEDRASERRRTERCIATLSAKADLRHYTTTEAVADLDAVRAAMHLEKINLFGISYGTRVAQQYALRHPGHVRTITLDSPVPNTLGLGNIFARNLDNALSAQFALCSRNAGCKAKMGDPRVELSKLLARLRTAPVEVVYRDASTGEQKTGTLTADKVAGLVRMYAYMPAAGALLPQLIHEAAEGRYASLMALAEMLSGQMEDGMAIGMQMSVVCSEDAGSFIARPDDADTVLGNRMVDTMAAACAQWPKGRKPADFNTPLRGDWPVLILTGEFDPVTPPAYGQEIARTLPNSRWLNLVGQGHNVIGAGCMPKLFAQFIEKADAKGLDAKCLGSLAQVQPFTTYNGWEP